MDAGTKHQTTDEDISDLSTPSPHTQDYPPSPTPPDTECIAPAGPPFNLHRNRQIDVSIDTKTLPMQGEAETWAEEGVAVPRYIPAWVLPQEDIDSLRAAGAGAVPDIIYARGAYRTVYPMRAPMFFMLPSV
jgi:hypothetical protein